MNKKEMAIIALKISNIYNIAFSADKIRDWHDVMVGVEFKKAYNAVMDLCRTSKYPPTPASIINQIAESESTLPTYLEALELLSEWINDKITLQDIKDRSKVLYNYAKMYGKWGMNENWSIFKNVFKKEWQGIQQSIKLSDIKAITCGYKGNAQPVSDLMLTTELNGSCEVDVK